MKKKILSMVLTAVLGLMTAAGAAAQDIPKIMAGEREISLDVEGEYVNGVFMAPVRRICSIAEARCDWYGDEQKIILNTKDNVTRVFLYIQRDTFRIFTFTSIIDGVGENLQLEAPLKIVNDRTLVPFEQICRALKLEYEWSEDKSVVTVKTDEVITDDKKVELSLVPDKEDVAAGEEVTFSLIADNMDLYPDYYYSGYTAGVVYNKEEFEFIGANLTHPDGTPGNGSGAENADFSDDSLKVVYITLDKDDCTNGMTVGTIKMKALTDNGGTVRLSDRISTVGYDTSLLLSKKENDMDSLMLEKASVFKINIDEVVIK